jgi:hypothetical protein
MISTTTTRVENNGNGVTTVFSFPYLFYDSAHLVVKLVSLINGVETLQTITTHYTVAGVGDVSGGTVTMLTPPGITEKLRIERVVPFTQLVDYIASDSFPAETHEEGLDRIVMMVQQLATLIQYVSGGIYTNLTVNEALTVNNFLALYRASYTFPSDTEQLYARFPVTEVRSTTIPFTMSATPTIRTDIFSMPAGSLLFLVGNHATLTVTLQSESALPGSGLTLCAATRVLGLNNRLLLICTGTNTFKELFYQ